MRRDVLEHMAEEIGAHQADPLASFTTWDEGRRKLDGMSRGKRWDIDREQREWERDSRADLHRLRRKRWQRSGAVRCSTLSRHPGAKLTPVEVVAVLEALARNDRVSEIARRFRVARLVVRLIGYGVTYKNIPRPPGFGVVGRPRGKLSPVQVRAIVDRLVAGARNSEIAKEFGVSPTTISSIRHGRGQHRGLAADARIKVDTRRTNRSRAKLVDEQVHQARRCLWEGMSTAKVARRFGVSFQTIASLRDGRSYRHIVTPPAPPSVRAPLRSAA